MTTLTRAQIIRKYTHRKKSVIQLFDRPADIQRETEKIMVALVLDLKKNGYHLRASDLGYLDESSETPVDL